MSEYNTVCGGEEEEEELLVVPDNFSMVMPGIYRSGFPTKKHFPFLSSLRLRTVLFLCPEEYPSTHVSFMRVSGTRILQFGVEGNKEPCTEMPQEVISMALLQVLDTRNHPMLIHCNKGKHRTGCLVGVLRRVCGWSLSSIFAEYELFSFPKSRYLDRQFIELFTLTIPNDHAIMKEWKKRKKEKSRKNNNGIQKRDDVLVKTDSNNAVEELK